MYDAAPDPYCYGGSTVLRNILGIRDQAALDAFEAVSTAQRAEEPLPDGQLSVRHYKALHRHLFQDVYPWAGKFRTVRIGKEGSAFCYPENIAREMARLFASLGEQRWLGGLSRTDFCARGGHFLATLNAVHPFREGNGRTQTAFFALLADRAGHRVNLDELDPATFLPAMIASFHGNEAPLVAELLKLTL